MIYTGQFNDINNQHTYTVEFTTIGQTGNQEIKLMYDAPVTISYANEDDIFEPIKTYSASVSILTHDYLFDLYNVSYDVKCKIYDENNNIIFWGYVTPNIYSTDYENWSNIVVECISPIAMLKYEDYTSIEEGVKGVHSIGDIIQNCLKKTMLSTNQNLYMADVFNFNNGLLLDHDLLGKIILDEHNFFDDNEEQTPWKCYDVLAEICRYLNLSLCEHANTLYMMHYRSLITNVQFDYVQYIFNKTGDRWQAPVSTGDVHNTIILTKDIFNSSDNSLSLSETYKKIKVKCNTYPYEDIFTDMMDTEYWELWNGYDDNYLRMFSKIPQLIHSTSYSKNGYYNFFWFYFTSNRMKVYKWDHNTNADPVGGTPLTPNQDANSYLTSLIPFNQTYAETVRNNVGVGLMRSANYEVTDDTLVSSLSWNKNIILYTGIGNYTTDYNSDNHYDKSHELADTVWEYLLWCSKYDDNDDPLMKLIELTSDSNIIVSKESYLVIGGQMGYFGNEYEDPSIKEYTGKDKHEKAAFKQPFEYAMVDHYDDKKNRGYFGFPFLNIQVEIGDKILCQYNYKPEGEDRHYIGYFWDDKGHGPHIYGEHAGSPIITIPVGTTELAWMKMMDITNTCDWRLGINNGKGFALPLKVGLNGTLKVTIINANPDIVWNSEKNGYYINTLKNLRKHAGMDYPEYPIQIYDPTYITAYDETNPWHATDEGTWYVQFNKYVYKGFYPNYLIIRDLTFKIYDVVYNSIFDTTQKVDNKNSDQEYSNVINENSIEEYDDIELKINTQVSDKNFSFSSAMYHDNTANMNKFVENMSLNQGDYKVQENNIIDSYVNHYNGPKCMFDADLKTSNPYPFDIYVPSFKQTNMILNGGEWDLHAGSIKSHLVEF